VICGGILGLFVLHAEGLRVNGPRKLEFVKGTVALATNSVPPSPSELDETTSAAPERAANWKRSLLLMGRAMEFVRDAATRGWFVPALFVPALFVITA
jgi:hypothetical protein